MSMTAKLKGYRKWHVDQAGGIDQLTARYQAIRDANPAGDGSDLLATVTGLPPVGEAIDESHPNLIVRGYSFEEGEANEKRVLTIDVNCSLRDPQNWDVSQFPPRGQAIQDISFKTGSVSRDFVSDAITGKLVLNSAGQPFDSVPQVDRPAHTFTKVVKSKSAQSWAQYFGMVNSSQITVAGFTCDPHTVRCVQADRLKLWNDEFGFVEQWTIGLQIMSNLVKIEGGSTPTEIGWDIAVVDQGTMELVYHGEGSTTLEQIMVQSKETGKMMAVSQPVLLDGSGHAMLAAGSTPYAMRFSPYKETTFPSDFYSES